MKNFIKVYSTDHKEVITININTIANYRKANHTDGSYSYRIVYTNIGVVNSEIRVRETIEEIDNLIIKAS